MQPLKGLNLDTRPISQAEGTYPFGKNGLQFDLKSAVTNEPGFKKMSAVVPYRINGIIETDSKPIIFSTDNTNSAIGYFDPVSGLYEPKFDDTNLNYKLGFKLDWYITGQAQRNYKGEMVCAFTDKFQFPKYMNVDNLQVTKLEDWNLFPFYKAPKIKTSVDIGGRLAPGTYYVTSKYQRNDGTETPYSPVSLGKTVSSIDQNSFTDKSLTITLSNTDSSYDFIVLAIISRINGVTRAVELEPVPISDGETIVVYTGDNLSQDISLEEILTPPAIYTRVGTMGQLNDALYLADLDKQPDVSDMQPFANMVKIEWVSQLLDAVGAPDNHVNGEIKGLMHEEVYALYIRYNLIQGGVSKAFTLPGYEALPGDLLPSLEANTGGFSAKKFQVEDCIHNFNAPSFTGETGVWLNETEKYPIDDAFDSTSLGGIDNKGKAVRHHKMPTIRWCKANLYNNVPEYGRTKLDILGIKATNIIIPPKYADKITGYQILYAKRTVANMTVYGQGLMLHGSSDIPHVGSALGTFDIYSTGANWHSDIAHKSKGDYNDNNDLRVRLDTFRFHAFDILLNKPAIQPNHISSQLKLRKDKLRAEGYYENGEDNDNELPTVHLVDYTNGAGVTVPQSPVPGRLVKKIKTSFYANNGITVSRVVNVRHETCLAGTFEGPNWPLSIPVSGFRLLKYYDDTPGSSVADFEESYLINMMSLKKNLYVNFYSQSLIAAGDSKLLDDSSPYFGGDIFVCDYTYHTYGRHSANDETVGPSYNGKKIVRRFVCESISNIHLRYEIPGNEYSKWYPRTFMQPNSPPNCYPVYWDRNKDPNQFGYSKDLNALNDLISTSIFNPSKEELTRFPYRIHRGGKLSRQTKFRSWRTFLPLDYYECQKNMGYIQHLEGMDDRLLIHHENALFFTQDKAKLESGLLSITLGSGDIFQFEPQEAQSAKLGYAGTQHELACVRTPAGYVFFDAKQGEMYLYKGKLTNLGDGVDRFFKQFGRVQQNNPFTGNGITIGWDQAYKRILLTIKNRIPAEGLVVKVFNDNDQFWDNLNPGDLVWYKGKVIVFQGLNDSPYDCPADLPPVCLPVTNLQILVITKNSGIATWDGAPDFRYTLEQLVNNVYVQLKNQTTNLNAVGFPGLASNTFHRVRVYKICGPGNESIYAEKIFKTLLF